MCNTGGDPASGDSLAALSIMARTSDDLKVKHQQGTVLPIDFMFNDILKGPSRIKLVLCDCW